MMKAIIKTTLTFSLLTLTTLASTIEFQDFNQAWSLHENVSGDCAANLKVKVERSSLNYDYIVTVDEVIKAGDFRHEVINANKRVIDGKQEMGEIQGGRLILSRHRKQILSKKYSVLEKKLELDMNLPYLNFKSYDGDRLKRSCIYVADNAELVKPVQTCELLLDGRPVSRSECNLTASSSGEISCMINASVHTYENRDDTDYNVSYFDIKIQGQKRELYNLDTKFKVSFKYEKSIASETNIARVKELAMAIDYPVSKDRELNLNVMDSESKLVLRCE